MATTVKTGWLKDRNGDKFAPKTLTSQVQTSDGILLEDKIQADLDAAKEDILANVSIDVDNALSSTSENPVQNRVVTAKFDEMQDAISTAIAGTGNFIITANIGDGELTDVSATFEQIYAAYEAKKNVVLHVQSPSGTIAMLRCSGIDADNAFFDNATALGETKTITSAIIFSDDTSYYVSDSVASDALVGTTDEITPAQVKEAIEAGRNVAITHTTDTFGSVTFNFFSYAAKWAGAVIGSSIVYLSGGYIVVELLGSADYNIWQVYSTTIAETEKIDAALANKADKATSLAGYGITDAYNRTEIDNLVLITVDDIDTICGTNIEIATASEVVF